MGLGVGLRTPYVRHAHGRLLASAALHEELKESKKESTS